MSDFYLTKCDHCGYVKNNWYRGDCIGFEQFKKTDKYTEIAFLDGPNAAARYFEKHVCNPREFTDAEKWELIERLTKENIELKRKLLEHVE